MAAVDPSPNGSARDGLRIAAGVLHYRAWPDVRVTIDSLLGQTRPPDVCVVLDHASRDGSAQALRDAYPQVEVVEAPDNHGPSAGMNRAFEAVLSQDVDAVVVVPDDMKLAPDVLEQLANRLASDPEIGGVAPLVAHRDQPERVFCAGGYVDPRTWDLDWRENPPNVSDWAGAPPQDVHFLGTGGLLMRVPAARSGGEEMLPEHFHHGFDDVDYTLRLRAEGWRLECLPGAVVWQDLGDRAQDEADRTQDGLLPPANPYLVVRNQLGLVARNAPRRKLVRELVRVIKWIVWDAVRPRSGSRSDLKPRLRGLIDFCRGRWGPPPAGL